MSPCEKPCAGRRRRTICRTGTRWSRAGRGCPERRRSGGRCRSRRAARSCCSRPSRQAKPTRGLKLFLSVLISVSRRPAWSAVSVRFERDEAWRQLRRDLGVRHDVVAAVGRHEVGELQVLLVPDADDLVAQPEVHRQVSAGLPVVLDVCRRSRWSDRRAAAVATWSWTRGAPQQKSVKALPVCRVNRYRPR